MNWFKWLLIRREISKQSMNAVERKKVLQIAKTLHTKPQLARSDKQQMLNAIVPQTHRSLRPLVYASTLVASLLIAVPSIVSSQPGDGALYNIKQGAEAIRNVLQPGFEPVEQTKPANLKEDDDHKASDSDVDDHQTDKNQRMDGEYEKRHDDDSSDSSKESPNSGSGNTSGSGHEIEHELEAQNIDKNTARNACRALLDAKKDAGEDVDSDEYKSCDN